MPNLPKKPENKNAIDAVAFRAGTLGIYGRHLLVPNPNHGSLKSSEIQGVSALSTQL